MARQPWLGKIAESWLGLRRRAGDLRRTSRRLALQGGELRVEILEDRLAPSADLVKDINLQPNPIGSHPSQLLDVNGIAFFVADDAAHGAELWKSDGSAAGTVLVKDIRPGSYSSNLSYLTNVNGTLFFRADDGVNGAELWKSDGTAAGTVRVRDLYPGPTGSNPSNLTSVNGMLFFSAMDETHGPELWKSDGTAAGTVLVRDIRDGNGGSSPSNLTNVNGSLFFTANDSVNGTELWKSDGTTEGTVLVKDIRSGGSYPSFLTSVNGTLFFSALDNSNRTELWKSDGTAAGTVLVKNIGISLSGANPSYLTNVGGTLFFRADDGVNGSELWKSDGTAAGTVLVKDILSGSGGSGLSYLTNVSGTLYFRATEGSSGYELWKSDGTAEGTVLVKDIRGGAGNSNPGNLTNVNGVLYFQAFDDEHGTELWRSDGTTAGTVLVKDIRPGVNGADPRSLTRIGGTLFFRAFDDADGLELWKSDGSAAGTVLVKDIRDGTHGSYPSDLANVNSILFFRAFDNVHGFELWKSDGTTEGTVLVKDILPGSGGSYPHSPTNVNGTLFFVAYDSTGGDELWKSDGSAAGTVRVKDIRPGSYGSNLSYLTNVNGTLFFTATDGVNGTELWKSDGTAEGTVLVKDLRAGFSGSYPSALMNVGGTLFFRATDDGNGSELWKSDGSAGGTVLVKDIRGGSQGSYPSNLTNVNGTLFFSAFEETTGTELWKSDGSAAGTVLVKDLRSGTGSSVPTQLASSNGTLFFSATDGVSGTELWKSDGSAASTVLVKDIRAGYSGSYPGFLTDVNGTLFFSATHDYNRSDLWKSDGTAAGTVPVQNLTPGGPGTNPSDLASLYGLLYFSANGPHGYELWQSDGTAAGTGLAADVAPGSADSSPQQLIGIGGVLFFTAVDLIHGRELWRLTSSTTNAVALDGSGNLTVEDIGGNRDDSLTLSVSGSNLVLFDPNGGFRGSAGTVSSDGHTLSVPLASVTGQISVNSAGGQDTLTVNFGGGNPVRAGGLQFNGANLVLQQGGAGELFDTITHTLADGSDSILLDPDGTGGTAASLISCAGATVVDNLAAPNRVFEFTGAGEVVTLSDGSAADDGRTRLTSSLGGSVEFANPSVSLTLDTATGAAPGGDTVTIASLDGSYRAALTLATDGSDTVNVNAAVVLGSASSAGDFTIANALQVNLNADVRSESGGNLQITGLVNLGANVTLSTDAVSGPDGNITINGSLNASSLLSPSTLALAAGDGDVLLGNAGTIRKLRGLNVIRANQVRLGQVETTVGGIAVTATDTTLNGTLRTVEGSITLASNVMLGAASVLLDSGAGSLAVTGTTLALGSSTLTVSSGSSAVGVISAQITGAGTTLTKVGAGTLILTGNNTYSGITAVNGGTLRIDNTIGSGTGSSSVTVNGGGILAGTGAVSGPVQLNTSAHLAPGIAVGSLSTDSVTWSSGAFFDVDLNGPAGPGVPGGHDILHVSGTVTLDDATLRLTGNLDPNPGTLDPFVLIDNDGSDPVLGTFQGLPEGAEVAVGSGKFYISYAGGTDRNDVVLHSQPIVQGTDGSDTLIVRGNGTSFSVSLNGGPAVPFSPSSGVGFHFEGGAGNDVLIVQYDATSPDPIPSGGIFFDGDILRLIDLRSTPTLEATLTPSLTTPGSGTAVVAGDTGGTIAFTGVTALDFAGLATAALATPSSGGIALTLDNGFDAVAGITPALIVSGTPGLATHFFRNGQVVVDTRAGDGDDAILLAGAVTGHGNARLAIRTGSGSDGVTVSGPVTFSDRVEIESQNIAINAPIAITGPPGRVELDAGSGAITAGWPGVDVVAANLVATAGTEIDLDTTVDTVTARLTGSGDIRLNETDGLSELSLDAALGIVTVTTGGPIRSSDSDVDVIATAARFNVIVGDFGDSGTAPGHAIQTRVDELSVDTSGSDGNQYIRETGSLTALNLNADMGNVALFADAVADSDAAIDIAAASLFLVTATGVGSGTPAGFAQPLQTQVSELDARNTTSGGIFLINSKPLTILDAPLDADPLGLVAVGGGRIEVAGPLTLRSNAVINDSMTLSAIGNDLVVQTGVTVLLNSDSALTLTLEAHDNITFQTGAGVATGGAVGPYTVIYRTDRAGASQQTPLPSAGLVAQRAADVQTGAAAAALTMAELTPIVEEALQRLSAAGASPGQIAVLSALPIQIADLNGLGLLGQTEPGVPLVTLDDDGAGHGWFVDPTPGDSTEFGQAVTPLELQAVAGVAGERYDLLTVVMHEFLSVIGQPIQADAVAPHSLMAETLSLATRRLPELLRPAVAVTLLSPVPSLVLQASPVVPPHPAWLQRLVFGRGSRRRTFIVVMNAAGTLLNLFPLRKGKRAALKDVNGDGVLDVVVTDRLTKKVVCYSGIDFRRMVVAAQRRRV